MKKKLIVVLSAFLFITNAITVVAADSELGISNQTDLASGNLNDEVEISKEKKDIVGDEEVDSESEDSNAEVLDAEDSVEEAESDMELEKNNDASDLDRSSNMEIIGNEINKQSANVKALQPVTDLSAISSGKSIQLGWNESIGAEGYIIYRQIGSGKFQYLYMVSRTDFLDTSASIDEFNFYRIYPYITDSSGKRIIGTSTTYVYAKPSPSPVTNLSAKSTGYKQVTISWSKVKDAEGYIIYRQVGRDKMSYRYMVSGTSFVDSTASNEEYNYYRIYPYFTNSSGKRILGSSTSYVYTKGQAKKVIKAVTNLRASSVAGGVKLSWNASAEADGYLIYGQVAGREYGFVGMSTNETTYTDRNASQMIYNFYWVFPYYKGKDGGKVVGEKSSYVYGRAKLDRDEKQDNTLAALALILLDEEAQYFHGSRPVIENIYLDTNGKYQIKYKSDFLTFYATCGLFSADGTFVYSRIYHKDIPNEQVLEVCTWIYGHKPQYTVFKELPKNEIMTKKAQLVKQAEYTMETGY